MWPLKTAAKRRTKNYIHEIAISKVAYQPRMNKGYSMWPLKTAAKRRTKNYTHEITIKIKNLYQPGMSIESKKWLFHVTIKNSRKAAN